MALTAQSLLARQAGHRGPVPGCTKDVPLLLHCNFNEPLALSQLAVFNIHQVFLTRTSHRRLWGQQMIHSYLQGMTLLSNPVWPPISSSSFKVPRTEAVETRSSAGLLLSSTPWAVASNVRGWTGSRGHLCA